jgi:ribosomal protein S18 acetylase RimI-like enzyme
MKHITIRELTTIEEMLSSYDLLCILYPTNFSIDQYRDLLKEMLKGNYRQVVAVDGEHIVGVTGLTIATKIWSGKYMDMDHFVVSRDIRSSGIGKQIMQYVKELSLKEECKILSCDVYSENFEAQRFYMNERFVPRGFHFVNTIDKSIQLKAND